MKKIVIGYIISIVLLLGGNVDKFISSARWQIGKTVTYNPEYVRLRYPNGDIPISKGVCTDVVVRALRGLGIDLQSRIYRHKKTNPSL